MSELSAVLEKFKRIDGVAGAMIIDRSGNVVESVLDDSQNAAFIAGSIVGCIDGGAKIAAALKKGNVQRNLIHSGDNQYLSEAVTDEHFIVIAASSKSNLGRIRLELRKNKGAAASLLA
ncbi:MAG: hypothetical protein K6G50_05175 [bacterium]|nr:hypothetical protein [bacterium]